MLPPTNWELATTFNRIALASFGGGLSAWSREIIVRERGWISEEEFISASTLCRILPGANQVNLAVFVGMRLHGIGGAAAAVLGLITVPMFIVLLAGTLYIQYRQLVPVQRIMAGVTSAAVGLTLALAWQQGRRVLVSAVPFGLFVLTLVLSAFWRSPLWLTLMVLAPVGFAWAWRDAARE